jgi:hypothetical protein
MYSEYMLATAHAHMYPRWAGVPQDHGHSEPARDRDEGVEEDPELENIEPFSEGNDVT